MRVTAAVRANNPKIMTAVSLPDPRRSLARRDQACEAERNERAERDDVGAEQSMEKSTTVMNMMRMSSPIWMVNLICQVSFSAMR